MDVLKMTFTPLFTPRPPGRRDGSGSSAGARRLQRRCPNRAGLLGSARVVAHSDARRVRWNRPLYAPSGLRARLPVTAVRDPTDGCE